MRLYVIRHGDVALTPQVYGVARPLAERGGRGRRSATGLHDLDARRLSAMVGGRTSAAVAAARLSLPALGAVEPVAMAMSQAYGVSGGGAAGATAGDHYNGYVPRDRGDRAGE